MRIGLDCDGVFYPFISSVRNYLVEHHSFKHEQLPDTTVWDFPELEWGLSNKDFYRYCAMGIDGGHIFLKGDPEVGSVEAIKKLRKDGHSVHICTSRQIGSKDAANTYAWLKEHGIEYDSLTFASDKTILDVDIFLEDKPDNFYKLENAGVRSYIYDQPWNQEVDTLYRIFSWEEFSNVI